MEPWGHHLLLNCTAGDLDKISSRDNILNFVKKLVIAIDMESFGPCWCEDFATHDISKAGYSFIQMITTSNISGHFVSSNGNFYIDVFSCKPFDNTVVHFVVSEFFNPNKIQMQYIARNA
jgi:S-adenosylmethionine/arginine decarboxylase-like enzyme